MWCYELTATTILHLPAPLKVGMKEWSCAWEEVGSRKNVSLVFS